MKSHLKSILILFILSTLSTVIYAQEQPKRQISPKDTIPISLSEKRFMEKYERNIKKSRINGVYIPVDLKDAFNELTALSSKESLDKFKYADTDFVVRRLHYGIGRWITVNWNLYDGSRIGHHLKTYGVTHPGDQVKFLLTTYHNHLNSKDLDVVAVAAKILAERAKELEKRKLGN